MNYKDENHFLPLTREELINALLYSKELNDEKISKFKNFFNLLGSIYHYEFHIDLEKLKSCYKYFNPDIDLIKNEINTMQIEVDLIKKIHEILINGNYKKVTRDELDAAINEEGILPVSTKVNFEYFDYFEIHYQGTNIKKEKIKSWNPLRKKEIELEIYDRIIFLFKVKENKFFQSKKIRNIPGVPGKIYLKYFRNIPKSDLEIIFPNPKPKMKYIHKLKISIPLIIGFIILIHNTVIKPYFLNSSVNTLQGGLNFGMIAILTALGGYVFKVYNNYKNTVQKFLNEITQSLYFKDVGNNQGVFSILIDSAEEEECKEAMLAYYFLLNSNSNIDEKKLDNIIEEWLKKEHQIIVDFEVGDAINKLKKLNLLNCDKNQILTVPSLDEALNRMDHIWDNYFKYNK